MSGRSTFSETAYKRVATEVKEDGGSATSKGEQRHKEGKGLHELVDPKGYGVIRRSYGPFEAKGKRFTLVRGVAMLIEMELDTTGSMGGNVDLAFHSLPKTYNLLARGPLAPLSRYDVQMITAIFGDVTDNYILCRSQAEMDEQIAEQMRLMVPEKQGGDGTEDPHYGLFGAAYLTHTQLQRYELKHYHFMATDADSRKKFSVSNLKRVFGEEVLDKVRENGHDINEKQLPELKQVVNDLLTRAHAFMLQIGTNSSVTNFWKEIYGNDRVIILEDTKYLPEVQAAIIGLTEGTLDLQNLEAFLVNEAKLSSSVASTIVRAVSKIPIGAQAALENFSKLPVAGDMFADKNDLWPIGSDVADASEEIDKGATDTRKAKKNESNIWL
ncbi:MAG: hypothetical protein WCG20_01960 [bacterium]